MIKGYPGFFTPVITPILGTPQIHMNKTGRRMMTMMSVMTKMMSDHIRQPFMVRSQRLDRPLNGCDRKWFLFLQRRATLI